MTVESVQSLRCARPLLGILKCRLRSRWPLSGSVCEGHYLPRVARFESNQDFTDEGARVRHALPFGLDHINGNVPLADVVVFGDVVVKRDQDFKASGFRFGQQLPIQGSGPTEGDDMGASCPMKSLTNGTGKFSSRRTRIIRQAEGPRPVEGRSFPTPERPGPGLS